MAIVGAGTLLSRSRCVAGFLIQDIRGDSINVCRGKQGIRLSYLSLYADARQGGDSRVRTNHEPQGSSLSCVCSGSASGSSCHRPPLQGVGSLGVGFHRDSWPKLTEGRVRTSPADRCRRSAPSFTRFCHVDATSSSPPQSYTRQQERAQDVAADEKNGGNGSLASGEGEDGKGKVIDMVTLGNLCVDVVVNVDKLPPRDREGKWTYMQKLMASPPDESFWEGGGNANTLLAGGRLGLRCVALGHVGDDVFGDFFVRILAEEGVRVQDLAERGVQLGGEDYSGETLLVWVLLDPNKQHAFCSRFDFNTDPVFSRLTRLPGQSEALIRQSKTLFINGFSFDEIPPHVVVAAARSARESGTAVFFDPGPRTGTLVNGSQPAQQALDQLLQLTNVLLLTEDEAVVLTGLRDPSAAARHLLERGQGALQWVIVKQGEWGCVMASHQGMCRLPGFKVEVADTVGCGDSFAAAVVLGFTNGESPRATLALANAVGAATAMGCGAGRNVASAERAEKILLGLQADNDGAYNSQEASMDTGRLQINGSPTCSSGIPLHVAVKDALNILRRSLKQKAQVK